jgi:hypothetical protein
MFTHEHWQQWQQQWPSDAQQIRRIVGVAAHIVLRLRQQLPVSMIFFARQHFIAAYLELHDDGVVVVNVYDSLATAQAAVVAKCISEFVRELCGMQVRVDLCKQAQQTDAVSCSMHATNYLLHRSAGFTHDAYCKKTTSDVCTMVDQLRALAISLLRSPSQVSPQLLQQMGHITTLSDKYAESFQR